MIQDQCPLCDMRTDTGGICRNCSNRRILNGDVLDQLKLIPDQTIDVEISSPPYWGLRDYGVEGQMGLEPDFRDYLKKLHDIMSELKRVLKKPGSCWINLGDSYGSHRSSEESLCIGYEKQEMNPLKGFEKSRVGIPERFYINCIDDGWIARNHIPWYKANSMPSSVKDRFTNKWESIFFFVKERKYYFNLDAVREKTITESKPFNIRVRENITGHAQAKLGDRSWTATKEEMERYHKDGTKKQDTTLGSDGKPIPTYAGFNERWKDAKNAENRKHTHIKNNSNPQTLSSKVTGGYYEDGTCASNPKGKNPGDVFFINPRPYAEAHFATFPVDLPLKILKCACPPNGIVLDPFFGSGTVGLAAEMLGLRWMGIELNEEYITLAKNRLAKYQNNTIVSFV